MNPLEFRPFDPTLDPAQTVMIDGWAPGFRMISHWPGHTTPGPLRHDLTTGSAFRWMALDTAQRRDLMGEFTVLTNNHYDTDGTLSLYTMLRPDVAARHRDLILRTARAGDFAVWGGEDALALELSIMADLTDFLPFSTPPFDAERLGNLSRLYVRAFGRLESMLDDPFALRRSWADRFDHVVADVMRIRAGEGLAVVRVPEHDLAIVETDRPITSYGLRLAAGDLFRVLLVYPQANGNRYRFCFRGESWWDVVSIKPRPRVSLAPVAAALNALEDEPRWWASPDDWTVPELGYGEPVTFPLLAVRFDPRLDDDPPTTLPVNAVVGALCDAFVSSPPLSPVAMASSQ